MPTRTLPRLPLIRHAPAAADLADVAATTDTRTNEDAPTADVIAVSQAPRVRRVVTIVTTALVLSVLATGVAAALARRYGKTRDARQTSAS